MRLLLIIIFSLYSLLQAQNLVPNPSFEEYKKCPKRISNKGDLKNLKYWYNPTKTTPNYFNNCSSYNDLNVPYNFRGFQIPYEGNGYIGLIFNGYIEYAGVKLTAPLERNKQYCISYNINLSNKDKVAFSQFGAILTDEKIIKKSESLIDIEPIKLNDKDNFITDTMNWTPVCGIYKANGGEEYLTIGNFIGYTASILKLINKRLKVEEIYAYYYIDMVEVFEIEDPADCDCREEDETVAEIKEPEKTEEIDRFITEKKLVIEDVAFDLNKYELKPDAFGSIEPLIEYLHKDPDVKIQINGYTDSIGTQAYNLELSEKRARSVAEHLIKKDISTQRINYKGYGEADPVADNSTEKGRAKNRRVEILLE